MVLFFIQGAVAQTPAPGAAPSQDSKPAAASQSGLPDYSANPKWFPNVISSYKQPRVPPADLANTKSLSDLIHDGKIELSLAQFATAVVENNLTLAADRYNNYFAQADLLRTKSGQAARGVSAANVNIPEALSSGAIGAGVGTVGGLTGTVGSIGAITGSAKSLTIGARGVFDPTFLFNVSWDRTVSPLNTLVVAGSPVVTTNTDFLEFGYQQAFPTGTSFSVDLANERQNSTQSSLIYNPDVITRLSVSVVQELTNGFGLTVNRRFETVARNDIEITKQWFLQQVDTTLAQAEDSYWNLVSAQEQVKATQQELQAAQQLYENNKMQEEVGTLAPLDVVTAQSQVASSQRDVIVAQTNLQEQELALKFFFSKKVTDVIGDAEIVATDPLPDPQDADVPPLEDALSTGARNRPEVPQAEKNLLNDQVAVKVSQKSLKPTFNIFGTFASGGLSGNQLISTPGGVPIALTAGLAQELNQLVNFRAPEYAIGFDLTIPIKNRSALADNARSSLQERQDKIALQSTENQVSLEVRSARINLIQDKSQVTAGVAAVDLSRQTMEAEQKKLAAGLSTPYNIILDQRNLLQAQLAEVQARATYANALVEMARSTGVIREKSHIEPEDALRGKIVR
jgi:outer membrane protein